MTPFQQHVKASYHVGGVYVKVIQRLKLVEIYQPDWWRISFLAQATTLKPTTAVIERATMIIKVLESEAGVPFFLAELANSGVQVCSLEAGQRSLLLVAWHWSLRSLSCMGWEESEWAEWVENDIYELKPGENDLGEIQFKKGADLRLLEDLYVINLEDPKTLGTVECPFELLKLYDTLKCDLSEDQVIELKAALRGSAESIIEEIIEQYRHRHCQQEVNILPVLASLLNLPIPAVGIARLYINLDKAWNEIRKQQ